ncbi:glycoside hydrolase [Micromonospora sp. NBC_01405]|uniref:sialidase family protein n=1 Tax=Micromonospora sp. NBC_01405 TaxID=2903589 RepID=UPI00324FB1A6
MRLTSPARRRLAATVTALFAVAGSALAATPATAAPGCDVPDPPPVCSEQGEPDQAPTGSFEAIEHRDGGIRVVGWATDGDTAGAVTVKIRRDGVLVLTATADRSRPDVGPHGFDRLLPAAPDGRHTVCVAAVNVYGGLPRQPAEKSLGCRDYVAGRQRVGGDPYLTGDTQHATAVEPDSFAWGRTIVSAYQVGRDADAPGGATNIGFATSYDAGLTWTSGTLPGITLAGGGPHLRASDPVVAYSARHGVWLTASLVINDLHDGVLVNRSTDGQTWSAPGWAIGNDGQDRDKEWVVCDNWTASPHYGTCYLTITNLSASGRIELARSTDGGLTWATVPNPRGAASSPTGNGTAPVVRPDGRLVVAYGLNGFTRAFTVDGAGAVWNDSGTIHAGTYHPVPGVRSVSVVSAEADRSGRIVATWHGCRAGYPCQVNDVLFSTSPDGVNWTYPAEVPVDCPDQGLCAATDRLAPTVAVDPNDPARIGILWNSYLNGRINTQFTSSVDGGHTWRRYPQTLATMRTDQLANSGLGRMLGEYLGLSVANGSAVATFPVGQAPPAGQAFDQAIHTYGPLGF